MNARLVVTCGDVNGIGLECFFKAIRSAIPGVALQLAVHPDTLRSCLSTLEIDSSFDGTSLVVGETIVDVLPAGVSTAIESGRMSSASGALAIAALETAAAVVARGAADAVVTLPISKEACLLAGFTWPGQTEFFGERWSGTPLMILMHHNVRVALATAHLPLRQVAHRITVDHLSERITALAHSLQTDFAIPCPSIAILGLNPHAGENGAIGMEELDVIEPAMRDAAALLGNSAALHGPIPADGFFGFGAYERFDGILAMYHDQGLIPLKLIARGGGVNVTAGLRHVRTSPDHGTAFDIAGKNIADPKSTREAILTAAEIVRNRRG